MPKRGSPDSRERRFRPIDKQTHLTGVAGEPRGKAFARARLLVHPLFIAAPVLFLRAFEVGCAGADDEMDEVLKKAGVGNPEMRPENPKLKVDIKVYNVIQSLCGRSERGRFLGNLKRESGRAPHKSGGILRIERPLPPHSTQPVVGTDREDSWAKERN